MTARVVTYEGEEIVSYDGAGQITIAPNVTREILARILVEAMNQLEQQRERFASERATWQAFLDHARRRPTV